MKKYSIYLITVLLASSLGCDKDNYSELHKKMTITVEEPDSLFADSASLATVKVDFGDNLLKEQEVTFTTSHGVLFRMPFQPGDPGAKSITYKPFSKEAELLLKANTLTPADSVYVSVTIDSFTVDTAVKFYSALPSDYDPTPHIQIVDAGETPNILVKLYRDNGYASNGLRFDLSATILEDPAQPDSLVYTLPPFVFSQNNEVKFSVGIVRHSPGARLRVVITPEDGELPAKSVEIRFE